MPFCGPSGLARARIDLELLHKAVPESWVPIVAALITDGPDTAAARAHAAIFDYSKESVKANRRRTAGTRSRATVLIVLAEASRLFSTIHSLRTLPACREWVKAPQLHMPDMPKGGYEVVAPRVETVRQAWQNKSSEIHERLGIRSIEEEMEALNALSDNAVCSRGLWRPTRDRAVLLLMVLTGGRRTALARLTRKDYVRDCEGPLPDCRRGAALDLLPRKSMGRDELRRKPIPAQAAFVLDFYISVMDRMAAAKGRPPASPDAPLLVAEPAQLKAVQEQWLYKRVAGTRKDPPLSLATRAIWPSTRRTRNAPSAVTRRMSFAISPTRSLKAPEDLQRALSSDRWGSQPPDPVLRGGAAR